MPALWPSTHLSISGWALILAPPACGSRIVGFNRKGPVRLDGLATRDWQPWFYRGLAALLMLFGLFSWATIIGVVIPAGGMPFEDLAGAKRAAIINLAVAYPVAATGLWMLTRWGVVIWLYTAAFEIVTHTVFAATFEFRVFPVVFHVALVSAYAVLVVASLRAAANTAMRERADRVIRPEDRPVGTGRFSAGARQRLADTLTRRRRQPPEDQKSNLNDVTTSTE